MTIKKKSLPESVTKASIEDEYYVVEKKRIAEETQKQKRIHEEDVHLHLVANIPYYEEAPENVRRALVQLNNLLLHRFDKPGMIYWEFFKKTPKELYEYASDFPGDLGKQEQTMIVTYLERKQQEEKTMVDIGFDEDGEEDEPSQVGSEEEETIDLQEEEE